MLRRLLPFLLIALFAVPAIAAHETEDHDRARAAVEAGEAVPLQDILDTANAQFEGSLLDVELEREHGRWIYEIRLLTSQGSLIKLLYDARTRELLKAKGHGIDAARRTR